MGQITKKVTIPWVKKVKKIGGGGAILSTPDTDRKCSLAKGIQYYWSNSFKSTNTTGQVIKKVTIPWVKKLKRWDPGEPFFPHKAQIENVFRPGSGDKILLVK